jgi:hypothetical protein
MRFGFQWNCFEMAFECFSFINAKPRPAKLIELFFKFETGCNLRNQLTADQSKIQNV